MSVRSSADGVLYLRNKVPLGPYPERITERLRHWAETAPDRVFMAERDAGGWRRLTYAEALSAARRIGTGLLARDLSAERPLLILSGNDLEHALLALARSMSASSTRRCRPPTR